MKTEPKTFRPRLLPFRLPSRCPACGAQSVSHKCDYPSKVKPFARRHVLFCTNCGFGFVPKSGAMLDKYYRQDYASQNRKDRDVEPDTYFTPAYRKGNTILMRYFARAKQQAERLQSHGATFGDVLDFGSGPGYFLKVCDAARKFAFEPDQASHKYLDYLGATRYETLTEIPENAFDVITASHSIEHLVAEELQTTLRSLLAALKPDGRLLIEVPQGGHSYLDLKGARQDPHTLFFTPQALLEAVKNAGAEVLFKGAIAKPTIPHSKDPIYTPDPEDEFLSAPHGRLTLVCQKQVK